MSDYSVEGAAFDWREQIAFDGLDVVAAIQEPIESGEVRSASRDIRSNDSLHVFAQHQSGDPSARAEVERVFGGPFRDHLQEADRAGIDRGKHNIRWRDEH